MNDKLIKIAIVTGFSESCFSLVKQCIVSAYCSMKEFINQCELTIYAYEYNHSPMIENINNINNTNVYNDFVPFTKKLSLSTDLFTLKNTKIVQKKASDINHTDKCKLADIKIYHDFATKYFDQYDFALFCHDDIIINENYNVFQTMISILSKGSAAFIGEPRLDCRNALSIRIYPYFIFASSIKFREYKLSFINDYVIFDAGIKSWPINSDGGSALLASCFQLNSEYDFPCHISSRAWFKHLKLYTDSGVETTNIGVPNSAMFKKLIEQADKYVDSRLYSPFVV